MKRTLVVVLALALGACGGSSSTPPDAMPPMPDAFVPECTMSATCPAATPLCDTGGSCVLCAGSADDGACAARNPATPRCGPIGACVECLANADCGSGLCRDNACVAATAVSYVSRDVAACSDLAHASTPEAPYCEIQPAIRLGGRPYVLVAGSATTYAAVLVALDPVDADLSVTVVGPGLTATPGATVQGAGFAFSAFAGQNRTLDLRVEGFTIKAPTTGTALSCDGSGISRYTLVGVLVSDFNLGFQSEGPGCRVAMIDSRMTTGSLGIRLEAGTFDATRLELDNLTSNPFDSSGATVTLHDLHAHQFGGNGIWLKSGTVTIDGSIVEGGTGPGVYVQGGNVTLVDSTVRMNAGNGLTQMGGTTVVERNRFLGNTANSAGFYTGAFTFRNNLASGNGSAAYVATTGTFAFNTLIGNLAQSVTLSCAGDPRNLTRSIVFGNYATAGSQFQGTCVLSEVVTGADSFAGATQLDPALGSDGDFDNDTPEKLAKNQACCLDKVTPAGDVPTLDLLRRARGALLDLGAYEAP